MCSPGWSTMHKGHKTEGRVKWWMGLIAGAVVIVLGVTELLWMEERKRRLAVNLLWVQKMVLEGLEAHRARLEPTAEDLEFVGSVPLPGCE